MKRRDKKKGAENRRTKDLQDKSDKQQPTSNELVFGKNPVLEVIENSSIQVNKIWLGENLRDFDLKETIISYAKEKKIPFQIVPQGKLNKLTNSQNHQGLVLSISPINYLSIDEVIQTISTPKIILIAHEVEDPHNLGALIRTFVGGGGKGIILTGRSSVGVNATVIKTSAGAMFQSQFARAANCINVLNKLKEKDFWIVGTDNSGDSQSIYDVNCPDQIAILVGNEHEGLGQLIKKNCDFLVRIPVSKKVDSLNVSVAFGIVLFELLRQRQKANVLNIT